MKMKTKKNIFAGISCALAFSMMPFASAADITMDSNVQVKESAYAEFLNLTSVTPTCSFDFDYKAELKMQNVRDAYQNVMDVAATVGITSAQMEGFDLTGGFTVTVTVPSEFVIPADILNGTNMYGFSIMRNGQYVAITDDGANSTIAYTDPTVIYQESTPRSWDAATNTLTITLDVKPGYDQPEFVTQGVDNLLADLMFEAKNVQANNLTATTTGTDYKVEGAVTGWTEVPDAEDLLDLFGKRGITRFDYDAVQDSTINNVLGSNSEIQATIRLKLKGRNEGLGPGQGGSSISYAEIIIHDKDGKEAETIKEPGTATVDLTEKDKEVKGYIFAGWYTDKDLTNPIKQTTVSTTSTMHVYPAYIPTGIFHVEFYVDGEKVSVNDGSVGSVTIDADDIVVTEEGIKINSDNAKILGYDKNVIWYNDPELTVPFDSNALIVDGQYPDNIIKLYAKKELKDTPDAFDADDHSAYIIGYPDGTVRPENNISREEVTTIFYRLFTDETRNQMFTRTNPFPDVEAERWSNNAISTLSNGGYVLGYLDGTFAPEQPITRAEFVTIAARFFHKKAEGPATYTDVAGHWAEEYIAIAEQMEWINGHDIGLFYPDNYITRAETMAIVNRMLNRYVNDEGILNPVENWVDNPLDAWYYYDVIEATRSHNYTRGELGTDLYETWVEMKPDRDWTLLEK